MLFDVGYLLQSYFERAVPNLASMNLLTRSNENNSNKLMNKLKIKTYLLTLPSYHLKQSMLSCLDSNQ
tara:strand:- start:170 stop:373 length:204 start_codon:yes stop_codon:yes gene_type:complete